MARSGEALPGLSLVTDYGENGSSCGYCGKQYPNSMSHGMMADTMSVECYQELLDRGWRRSGRWIYYPIHERCCCQLLTIRLDATRFAPNKEQRRVLRKWQAHLEGAPLCPDPQQQQQQQQQQLQQPSSGNKQRQAQQHRGLFGGSPKRLHDELSDFLQWGQPPSASNQQQTQQAACSSGWQEGQEGGGKRHRLLAVNGGGDGDSAEGEGLLQGSSPTVQLSEQLRHAFRSSALPALHEGEQQALKQEQAAKGEQVEAPPPPPQQQQQEVEAQAVPASSTCPHKSEGTTSEQLASQLATALQQAVGEGQLPAAAYPPPKVQQPTPKQLKVLPASVTFTSAYPLAVAAAANKAHAASSSGSGSFSAEAVAAMLLQRLPAEMAAGAEVAKGHINFVAPAAPASAAPPASNKAVTEGSRAAGNPSSISASQPASQQQQQRQQKQREQQPPADDTAAQAPAIPRGVLNHFELRTLPSSEPTLVEVEFQLFKKYQVMHHGDEPREVTPGSFKRFLIDTPLRRVRPEDSPPGGCPSIGFGSFHQQYWLDGRLVAVGVVDVLPRCLSSKYLFWDPDVAPLSLGKLTSLKEIDWVRQAAADCPALKYYYLGFYVHDCHRMRYKGAYAPSDLLCPKNKCWVPLDRVEAALDQPGMVALSEVPGALEGLGPEHLVDPATGQPTCPPRKPTEEELSAMKVLVKLPGQDGQKAHLLTLSLMQRLGMVDESQLESVRQWWSRAGPAAASMIAFSDI